ncbi:ribose-5-phosphate isomerase RpiA [Gracilibacillus caseinilyticus]|uniref:Ribose-5-phosphate isomerase A n=1 Tax=Gracilibacillus caseinilyticus TaxID=2932256 RepID=A0ABY4EXS9_9BACI|nr:ribose-5-phosphate isomerase RpiA [Gracilibacillus caseinilyticus]UOQ48662.1 ribose-5-phosphate isomerase RpiA [Gracilibacillus caseinilyticus]
MDLKRKAGEKAAKYVEDGMIVGLGTGSTAYWAILKLGELVADGLNIKGIPTSKNTEELAQKLGIPMLKMSEVNKIDVAIDGADEATANFALIKGGGGALLREKMIASIAKQFIVVIDPSKYVERLGQFPLPVEIITFGWEITSSQISLLGCKPILRRGNQAPFVTDNGNYIVDCYFDSIVDRDGMNTALNSIPGVVENGLFVDMADVLIIGRENGDAEVLSF